MKSKRILGRLFGIVAAVVMVLVGTASPASAGTDSELSYASNGDGWAYLVANGDNFRIRDLQCDGGTVYAQLTWYKSPTWHYRTIHNTSGCNTTDVKHPWSDIPEGVTVWVRACGEVDAGYVNTGNGRLSVGHNCDYTQAGQTGTA